MENQIAFETANYMLHVVLLAQAVSQMGVYARHGVYKARVRITTFVKLVQSQTPQPLTPTLQQCATCRPCIENHPQVSDNWSITAPASDHAGP